MTNDELRKRSRDACLRIFDLLDHFPNNTKGWVVGKQLARSSSSVAANYRAACCARSRAEFVAKMCIVVEEADETVFWLEMARDSGIITKIDISDLLNESNAILKIFSAARKAATDRVKIDNRIK